MMELDKLKQTSSAATLATPHLCALWYDLHGDWDAAHKIVQALSDRNAMWIHAYLHRKEPDISNARYWYQNAGKAFPGGQSFEDEAATILAALV
jgi:hypothetical protein